jgi:predicted flavoprotein YhiN
MYDLIIIGGGASGVFASIIFKENHPNSRVIILEKSLNLLSKVSISGGGRCNLTNATFDPIKLSKN